mmetsp:Transcript_79528/g.133219  ORF Transcript_79528/g.133219 Transcript_79528/m.133219 type:complete len:372 (-) Transcript_79528:175-1290(-)
MQPALLVNGLRGLGLVVEVPHHHMPAPEADLTLTLLVPPLHVVQLQLAALQPEAARPELEAEGGGHCSWPAGLAHAVELQDVDPQRRHEIQGLPLDRGCAGHVPKAPVEAQRLLDFAVHQSGSDAAATRDPAIASDLPRRAGLRAHALREGHQLELQPRRGGGLGLGLDGLCELLPHARDPEKHRGADGLERQGQRPLEGVRAAEPNGVVAPEDSGVVDGEGDVGGLGRDMGHGEVRDGVPRGGPLVHFGGLHCAFADEVHGVVADHHALGVAGGAAGVDQGGAVPGVDGRDACVERGVALGLGLRQDVGGQIGRPNREKLVEGEHVIAVCGLDIIRHCLQVHDHALDQRQVIFVHEELLHVLDVVNHNNL